MQFPLSGIRTSVKPAGPAEAAASLSPEIIMMILEQLVLSMETVRLAKIDNLIQAELASRAAYAIKWGIPAPGRLTKTDKPIALKRCRSVY